MLDEYDKYGNGNVCDKYKFWMNVMSMDMVMHVISTNDGMVMLSKDTGMSIININVG